MRSCGPLWVIGLIAAVFALATPGEAATRRPKLQEPAPDIRAQVLEQRLADDTLMPQEVSQLSVTLAITYYHMKEFQREVEVLEDAFAAGIADTNLAGQAHYYLGRTYEALGNNGQAADEFQTVWEQYPGCEYHFHAAMEIGDLMLLASNTVEATQWYEAVRDLQPISKLAFLARDKLRAMARGESAEEITDESHRPVFKKEQFHSLDQYLYSQLYDKADALANALIASTTNAPERAALSYHLAHDYWMYGNVEGASRFVTNALQTTGARHVQALILAGHIQRALGSVDTALGFYRQAITAAPAKEMTITAYQQSTRLLYKSGRQTNALALAAAGKQAFTGTPELPIYLNRITDTLRDRADPHWKDYATLLAATSTNDSRQARLDATGQRGPAPTRLGRRRTILSPTGRPSEQGLAQQRGYARAPVRGATTADQHGGCHPNRKIIAHTRTDLSTEDVQAYVLYRLGKVWQANGQTATAEARWRQTVTQFPETVMAGIAQIKLARLYEEQGDLTNAVSMYEAYLQNSQTAPYFRLRAYGGLFRVKNAMGDPISANSMLDTAKSLALQAHDAVLELSLARYFLLQKQNAVAEQLLDAAYRTPKPPSAPKKCHTSDCDGNTSSPDGWRISSSISDSATARPPSSRPSCRILCSTHPCALPCIAASCVRWRKAGDGPTRKRFASKLSSSSPRTRRGSAMYSTGWHSKPATGARPRTRDSLPSKRFMRCRPVTSANTCICELRPRISTPGDTPTR